jgi:glutathione reductase (NADPH)
MVIHGAGRIPDVKNLNLEKGGVEYSDKGIIVNSYMQSVSNPAVYAVGDAAATPYRLAPKADMEGEIAAENIVHGNQITADYSVIPSVVFSQPPLSMAGMTEEAALKSGKTVRINKGDMHYWPSSKRIGQKYSAYKILIDEKNDRILGAHLLGKNADETINLFALAMRFNLTTKDLKKMLWAYPTYTSEIKYMIG